MKKNLGILICISLVTLFITIVLASACASPAPSPTPTPAPASAPTPTSAKPIKLTWASVHGMDSFPDRGVIRYAQELEKRSNGKLEFELFRGGSLLTPKDCIDGVLA